MKQFKNNVPKPESATSTPFVKAAKVVAAQPVSPKAQPKPSAPKREIPKVARVSFELVQPGAKRVCVAGSFNDWKPDVTPLLATGNGRWVGDLTVQPGRYEYLFVVDGQWVPDPKAKETVQNPFGGQNSVLGVSA